MTPPTTSRPIADFIRRGTVQPSPRRTVGVPADMARWARRQVEKIRTAWGAGRLSFPAWIDNYTDETPEIRDAYHGLLAEPMLKAGYGTKVWAVCAQECQVHPKEHGNARHRQAAAAFKQVLDGVGVESKNGGPIGSVKVGWNIASGALIQGWSLCEIVEHPQRGRWGAAAGREVWKDFKAKDTRRLLPLVDGFKNLVGLRSWTGLASTWEGADLDSFVFYAHWPLYESPSGMSDFRAVFRACWMKRTAMQLRALGLDRYTNPYFEGQYAGVEQQEALREALEDARSDGFVLVPVGAMVKATTLALGQDDVFASAIRDLNQEILIGTVGSHLHILEGQTTGGRGDTEVQKETSELFQWALSATIGGVVTAQMVRPWYERNFADVEPATVTWGAVNESALMAAAKLDEQLLKNGARLSRSERARYYGREEPADENDVLTPPGQPAPPLPTP